MGVEPRLHHANLLIASPSEAEVYLRSVGDSLSIRLDNNPDFVIFKKETFGIDEARTLKLLAARRAISSDKTGQRGKKIFLITAQYLTLEAQNALLKTFEDPSPSTYFFLAVGEENLIIPTLRSRMLIIHLVTKQGLSRGETEVEEFLALPIRKRLLFAKEFADEEKNLSFFLDQLLFTLRKQKRVSESIKNVYNLRCLMRGQKVPSPRLVIEHLSLVL